MKIYCDTEFSAVTLSGELMSVGLVADDGTTYYAEVSPLPEHRSQFVQTVVEPLLEGGATTVGGSQLAERIAGWLSQWATPIEMLVDSRWDVFMLRKALTGMASYNPGRIVLRTGQGRAVVVTIRSIPVLRDEQRKKFDAAVNQYRATDQREHHALSDAHAFRLGMNAVKGGLSME